MSIVRFGGGHRLWRRGHHLWRLRRVATAAVVVGGIALGAAPAFASSPVRLAVGPNASSDGVAYGAGARVDHAGKVAARQAGVAPPSPGATIRLYWAQGLQVLRRPSGYCLAPLYRSFPTAAAASAWQSSQGPILAWLFARRAVAGRFCAVAAPGGGPKPSRTSLVSRWIWTRGYKLLPVPRPSIAPGFGLVGNLAYLVDNSPTSATFSVALAGLGPLTMRARGVLYVDWGDSAVSGPYSGAGAPWPTGYITHAWSTSGNYDVSVTEVWSVSWSGAGHSGVVSGLHTTGVLRSFRVRQVVSLRRS